MGNYLIITAEAAKKATAGIVQGGVAIMIHGSMAPYITQAARQSGRAIRVTMDRENPNTPTHIMSTYAPHNGHTAEDKGKHWGDVKGLIDKTFKRLRAIWCADANGKWEEQMEKITGQRREKNKQYNRATHKTTEIEKETERIKWGYAKTRKRYPRQRGRSQDWGKRQVADTTTVLQDQSRMETRDEKQVRSDMDKPGWANT